MESQVLLVTILLHRGEPAPTAKCLAFLGVPFLMRRKEENNCVHSQTWEDLHEIIQGKKQARGP